MLLTGACSGLVSSALARSGGGPEQPWILVLVVNQAAVDFQRTWYVIVPFKTVSYVFNSSEQFCMF